MPRNLRPPLKHRKRVQTLLDTVQSDLLINDWNNTGVDEVGLWEIAQFE